MDQRLGFFKSELFRAQGKKAFLNDKLTEIETELKEKEKRLILLEKAQLFLQDVAKKTQTQLRFHIKDIVQLCLDTVWPGEIEFDLLFEIMRGKTECGLAFIIDGEEVDPVEADGGGLVHLAAFALRIAAWTLGSTRNTIILDEPLAALQPIELQRLGFKIIKELSEKLDLQFIIVKNSVNSSDLEDIADKVFNVKRIRADNFYESEIK